MQRRRRERYTTGFTVTELLVTVAISSIVLGLAIPSFRSLIADNRMVSMGNSVRTAALIARSTAVSLNRKITFCAGQADGGCHGDWSRQQWLVFDDRDRDGAVDADETVHLSQDLPAAGGVSVSSNGPFNNRVVFTPSGMAVTSTGAFAAGRLRFCVERGSSGNALELVLIGSGRFESEQKTLSDGCAPL